MQIELSENAIRFLNKLVPSLMLKPDNHDFLLDAQAIVEVMNAIDPKEGESDAPSSVQA